jgi:hypothetical protein
VSLFQNSVGFDRLLQFLRLKPYETAVFRGCSKTRGFGTTSSILHYWNNKDNKKIGGDLQSMMGVETTGSQRDTMNHANNHRNHVTLLP